MKNKKKLTTACGNLLILLVVIFTSCSSHESDSYTVIKGHLISLNADINVLIDKGMTSYISKGDTVTVRMHEVDGNQWKYDGLNYGKDTTFWIVNSYEDRTRREKLPPHFMHYARAIVK